MLSNPRPNLCKSRCGYGLRTGSHAAGEGVSDISKWHREVRIGSHLRYDRMTHSATSLTQHWTQLPWKSSSYQVAAIEVETNLKSRTSKNIFYRSIKKYVYYWFSIHKLKEVLVSAHQNCEIYCLNVWLT